jgi:hypothetical protein
VQSRSAHYRQLARECLAVANTAVREELRSALLEMAREWARLVDQQDADRERHLRRGNPSKLGNRTQSRA